MGTNSVNILQALVNMAADAAQEERSNSQMTLGKLIDRLITMPSGARVDSFGEPHSYRGYYSDLAFERRENETIFVEAALKMCRSCMGEVFGGYKGGNFQMGRNTPIWFAHYGSCGEKIVSLRDDGKFETSTDE